MNIKGMSVMQAAAAAIVIAMSVAADASASGKRAEEVYG